MNRAAAPPAGPPAGSAPPAPAGRGRRAARAWVLLASGAALLIAPGVAYSRYAAAWSRTAVARPPAGAAADAIAVLFAGFDRTLDGVNRETERRLDHALALFRGGGAPHLVVVGGNRPGLAWTGSELMARHLVGKGVAPAHVEVEATSYDSLTNLARIREIARARGWRSLWLVSSPEHLLRISKTAGDLLPAGVALFPYPPEACRPARGPVERWQAGSYHLTALVAARLLPAPHYESAVRRLRGQAEEAPGLEPPGAGGA